MTMTDFGLAVEFQIKALRKALEAARNEAQTIRNEPFRPWRDDDGEFQDRQQAAKMAVEAIEAQIIDLERSLRDPEQDAEMRAEMYAEMALTGVHDDVELYFHTPMQEELFQARIHRQIEEGWFDEDGGWNEGLSEGAPREGSCTFCHGPCWDDEGFWMNGLFGCENCYADIRGLFVILCLLSQRLPFRSFRVVNEDKWGDGNWHVAECGESEADEE